jgi:hypothetical protein
MNKSASEAHLSILLLLLGVVTLAGCVTQPEALEPTTQRVELSLALQPPEVPPSAFALSLVDSQLAGVVHYRWVLGEVPTEYYREGAIEWPESLSLALPSERLTLLVRMVPEPASLELRLYDQLDSEGIPVGSPLMSCGLFTKPESLDACKYEPPQAGSDYGRIFIEPDYLRLKTGRYYITVWVLWAVPSPAPDQEPTFRYFSIAYVFSFSL